MASSPQEKQQARFERFQKTLDLATQCQLDGSVTLTSAVGSDPREVDAFRRGLSESVLASLDHTDQETVPAAVERNGGGYCMVEAADGEFADLRLFHTLEGLVERLTNLVGCDVSVFPFFGTPLPISQGPDRFLLLPNDKAVAITKQQQHVDLAEEDVTVEESGFLGPPALGIQAPEYSNDDGDDVDQPMRSTLDDNDFDDDEDGFSPEPTS